jgi:hypothetical protein
MEESVRVLSLDDSPEIFDYRSGREINRGRRRVPEWLSVRVAKEIPFLDSFLLDFCRVSRTLQFIITIHLSTFSIFSNP